jgi:hypothetical protein
MKEDREIEINVKRETNPRIRNNPREQKNKIFEHC